MALLDLFFDRTIKRGPLTVTYPNGRTRSFGAPDPAYPTVAIRFTTNRVIRSILRDPALGAAEAFMGGGLVIEEGDILGLITLFGANSKWERGAKRYRKSPAKHVLSRMFKRVGKFNRGLRSKRNVAHHYDLSDRLYDLFLDADRQYSCAYYTDPANDLDRAQLDKKAHIAAKLAIQPGMTVLDIGCGWGGMALYLHQKTGAEVLGITLSEEQLKVARRRAKEAGVADKVRFELIDYREVTGTYDRIVSVGMFEHVGAPYFNTFLRKCRDLLTDHGVMLLHTIGRSGGPGVTDAFTAKYIFPGGYIPALSEIVRANEGLRWYVSDVEVLRLHYAYTLKAWYDRTVAAKDAIVALYDERFFRMWTFYLAGSYNAFWNGSLVNFQIQFAKNRNTLPITRDYMFDGERALGLTP